MEGFLTACAGRPSEHKQRCIKLGPLIAVEVLTESGGKDQCLDIYVIANRAHWQWWKRDTPFLMEQFLNKTSEIEGLEEPYCYVTETTDYVSKLDVERMVSLINERWQWDRSDTALTQPSIPIIEDVWSEQTFPFTPVDIIVARPEKRIRKETCFWN